MDERYKINVKVGIFVKIELRDEKEKFVTGKVKKVLSTNYFESSGILVKLDDDSEGRVKEILDLDKVNEEKSSYDLITFLEKKFRELIVKVLSQEGKWWKTRIPGNIYKSVQEKMERDEKSKKFLNLPKRELIDQIDFAHIKIIITKSDNWNDYFKNIFANKEVLETKLHELENLRNAVMHSKEISKNDEEKIRVYYNDLNYSIDNSKILEN